MLSSEKSIFENYDCGDPCQRKNAAVMVKTMHQNGLHDILPVLYKVTSILATIPATSCSAERSFSALRRIKTFLRSTMGQDRLSSIAVINIERKYANKTMQWQWRHERIILCICDQQVSFRQIMFSPPNKIFPVRRWRGSTLFSWFYNNTAMEFPVIYVVVQLYPWFKFYLPCFGVW